MKKSTLTKYKRVIDEWLVNGRNGRAAYQSVYPKSKSDSAKTEFLKILTNPYISEYVKEKENEIEEERKKKWKIDLTDLDRVSIEIGILNKSTWKGVDMAVKPSDRLKAIDMLYRRVGAYEKDNKQSQPINNNNFVNLDDMTDEERKEFLKKIGDRE